MSKCNCEHWETCPVCYPQGFDENGKRIPSKPYKTREELLNENAAQAERIGVLEQSLGDYGAGKLFGDQLCDSLIQNRTLTEQLDARQEHINEFGYQIETQAKEIVVLEVTCHQQAERIKALQSNAATRFQHLHETADKLAAAEKDADRYQWLRSEAHHRARLHFLTNGDLDAAIDAAIAAQKGGA